VQLSRTCPCFIQQYTVNDSGYQDKCDLLFLITYVVYFPDNCHEWLKEVRTTCEYFCTTNTVGGLRKLLVIKLPNCFICHADGTDNMLFCMECILGWMSNTPAVRI
jgi:hypothetical protein